MSKPFKKLRENMSLNAQSKAHAMTRQMLAELPASPCTHEYMAQQTAGYVCIKCAAWKSHS